ncbi:methyltransferase domain-containing protein [Aestuariirhabdus sp. Z084]|uniref:methyltransferase domain-containing protein n=1 Tax=Aestuariirhabdus haliotis TaxID=2918751 RepID=UPI00201B4023|nr:methyltransferase domain-containing protein [Aestuariirhabdus haliotis]MCL6415137.1 methyltransferase domain-containing protein [Aestuariirhabdus haliotis]MCL6419069.1 methyltransferase domain-containing protein [Aestuariirhabdus haliotis]
MGLNIDALVALSRTRQSLLNRLEDGSSTIEVHQAQGLRWLYVGDNSLLSLMQLEHPERLTLDYQLAMLCALLYRPLPERILDLGLGGGAFARFLHNKLPDAQCLSIERSPTLLSLAQRYFCLPETAMVEICDAEEHLQQSQKRYDLVLCDLFDGERHSRLLEQQGFYSLLSKRVDAGAVVALNILPKDAGHLLKVLLPLRVYFPYVALVDVADCGNYVLLAAREPLVEDSSLLTRINDFSDRFDVDLSRPLQALQHLPVVRDSD